MVLTAIRGALGFLSRLPVGRDEAAWDAFRETPAAFPLAGYAVGAVVATSLFLPLPAPTLAFAFVLAVVLVTGVNHADGVADLGDAAVVHGDAAERRDAMTDTATGVGGALALGVVLVGLALAGMALASLPLLVAVGLVVASEVSAKAAVAALVCLGEASHEGFGSLFTDRAAPADLAGPILVATPVTLVGTWPAARVAPVGAAAFLAALAVAAGTRRWARARLGGVSGDVFGATNELARVAALHAGVVAWTVW